MLAVEVGQEMILVAPLPVGLVAAATDQVMFLLRELTAQQILAAGVAVAITPLVELAALAS
jgi:hypothetical protein